MPATRSRPRRAATWHLCHRSARAVTGSRKAIEACRHAERYHAVPVLGHRQRCMDALRMSQQSLRVLADETGGFAAINRNDFAERVRARRSREQHVLRPRLLPDQRPPRRPVPAHRGAREAPRDAGAARRGYVAPRGRAPSTRPPAGVDALDAAGRRPRSSSPHADRPASPDAFRGRVQGHRTERHRRDCSGDARRRIRVRGEGRHVLRPGSRWCCHRSTQRGTVRAGERHVLTLEISAATRGSRARARPSRCLAK